MDRARGVCIRFWSAKPIWPEGMETARNVLVGFRAVFEADPSSGAVLRVATASVYRAFLNGVFLGYGPARGPHGYYRVDEWSLSHPLRPGTNLISIEVVGSCANSYYLLDQPSFLQAEIVSDGEVLASTGADGCAFEAGILAERVQKVPRYSFQRTFVEAYKLEPGHDRWRKDSSADFPTVRCAAVPEKRLIPRRVPYPAFALRPPVWNVSCGAITRGTTPGPVRGDPTPEEIGPAVEGFPEPEWDATPSLELESLQVASRQRLDDPFLEGTALDLDPDSYHILDFGVNSTGFVGAKLVCSEAVRLFFVFDEILTRGDIDFRRLNCVNIISYEFEPGAYDVETIEPYTLRFLKLIALDGRCRIERVHLREYATPEVYAAHFCSSDRDLNRIFEAARETFRQNAVDIFMDCPSRERAGWLCDSFFTARVARDLCGSTTIERNFLENYLLPADFPHLPEGMLPMCYPADHNDGNFIPNWALWFVLQLEEYHARSGDWEMAESLKPKVLGLLDYFSAFRNEYGLLEGLPGWVFVEWSRANDFVQDVNFPTNMLYAGALAAAGRLYGIGSFGDMATGIRDAVRRWSFDGRFFVDNAVRRNGKLKTTKNRTETCQYYAFFFDIASPDTHPELWSLLTEQFGPGRRKTDSFAEIHPSNAFIGNYLRMELLARYRLCSELLEEMKHFFLPMVDRTGTLWEHADARGSCNHGFASHVAHVLYRDILGVQCIETPEMKVTLHFADSPLEWCAGRIPIGSDAVSLRWWRKGQEVHYRVGIPAGYRAVSRNSSACPEGIRGSSMTG